MKKKMSFYFIYTKKNIKEYLNKNIRVGVEYFFYLFYIHFMQLLIKDLKLQVRNIIKNGI